MRPGVVWFGEALDPEEIFRIETFVGRGPADVVVVVGTTALFGYIIEWALRAVGDNGRLVEVNPEVSGLSRFATETIRRPAGTAVPPLVDEFLRDNS